MSSGLVLSPQALLYRHLRSDESHGRLQESVRACVGMRTRAAQYQYLYATSQLRQIRKTTWLDVWVVTAKGFVDVAVGSLVGVDRGLQPWTRAIPCRKQLSLNTKKAVNWGEIRGQGTCWVVHRLARAQTHTRSTSEDKWQGGKK